jgi:hypothetical protein
MLYLFHIVHTVGLQSVLSRVLVLTSLSWGTPPFSQVLLWVLDYGNVSTTSLVKDCQCLAYSWWNSTVQTWVMLWHRQSSHHAWCVGIVVGTHPEGCGVVWVVNWLTLVAVFQQPSAHQVLWNRIAFMRTLLCWGTGFVVESSLNNFHLDIGWYLVCVLCVFSWLKSWAAVCILCRPACVYFACCNDNLAILSPGQ